ncbi:MAG: pyridoxine 5'-phosphate synthase [Bacteroidia bacterium]|nr:pyridoxine 5'-phosphate synthase [Bacteroidia bacterium]
MTNLSVNVNKIALLRNSRHINIPNVLAFALNAIDFGADGITVHPRPDGRHIRISDVWDISKNLINNEFNIEGYPTSEFIELVTEVKPAQVTLVPDPPDAFTSSFGWNLIQQNKFLLPILEHFKRHNIRTSLFLDPDLTQLKPLFDLPADRIELYTEPYAQQFSQSPEKAIFPYIEFSEKVHANGIGINAGHDLNLQNLKFLKQQIPYLAEVSIGHALVADALYFGIQQTIQRYKEQLV